jgi:hypothetical protein
MRNPKLPNTRPARLMRGFVLALILVVLLPACAPLNLSGLFDSSPPSPTQIAQQTESADLPPEALVRFRVQVPAGIQAEEGIFLSVLDEVTGLAMNVERYQMELEDETHYILETPFLIGSVIKYRYTRRGLIPAEEHTSDGRQVRYRMVVVEGPGAVDDVVTRWSDTAFTGTTGRILGKVTDGENGQPLANILVTSGGAQTLTASDGSFLIEGLPPAIHNLVAYSLDGAYQVFQQGAQIAPEASTPANIQMVKAPLVNVTFRVTPAPQTPPIIPLRLAGNLYQLGNSYASLAGGLNSVATRMPELVPLPDGTYTLTIALPVGTDLRYKYTLGDGFWNAERTSNFEFRLRQLVIPESDVVVEDQIETWFDGHDNYIVFDVTTPPDTPPGDSISIQFNPYGWTEPLPMWPLSADRWVYFLYSPLRTLPSLSYRYCRNEQCNVTDTVETMGASSMGIPLDLNHPFDHPQETISGWNWWSGIDRDVNWEAGPVSPWSGSYFAGVEIRPAYHPSWQPKFPASFQEIKSLGANWVVLTPTWTYTRISPPILEQVTGQDPLWLDMLNSITSARNAGLEIALFPTPNFQMPDPEWWGGGKRDFSWWVVWFERYSIFLLHHADLAARNNIQALILGGDWLAPAMPGGTLFDGRSSGVPEDAELRWRQLIQKVHARYSGAILWALPYTPGSFEPPTFLDEVNLVYLLWSSGMVDDDNISAADLTMEAARLLDEEVQPGLAAIGKPAILAIAYPSANGGITGCVPDPDGGCLLFNELFPPNPDIPQVPLDFQEQVDAYLALLQLAGERDWISGVSSRGYYPIAVLADKSTSINGKPAADVLRYFYRGWGEMGP